MINYDIPVTVAVTTWAPDNDEGKSRCGDFTAALLSWRSHLHSRSPLHLHVADDGSQLPDYPHKAVSAGKAVAKFKGITYTVQDRGGVGASLNACISSAFSAAVGSDVILYMVDDWALATHLNIQPWVDLLYRNPNIGMVRLGPPHPGLTGTVQMFEDGWGLLLDRHHFAFSFRPCLIHRRFIEAYGLFPVGESSLETERKYNLHFCQSPPPGPEIVVALPDPWDHQYGSCFSDLNPRDRTV